MYIRYFVFNVKMLELSRFVTRKVLNEKILHYVLKNSRDKLQKYAKK